MRDFSLFYLRAADRQRGIANIGHKPQSPKNNKKHKSGQSRQRIKPALYTAPPRARWRRQPVFIAALLFAPLFHPRAQHLGRICAAFYPRLFEYLRHPPETDAGKWPEWISAFDTHAVLAVSRVFLHLPENPPARKLAARDGPEALCSGAPPLRFALFLGANLAPLKTALSHGFIGLGASKTGAKKRLAGRAAGGARVRGNAEKARAKCRKGAERVRKEFGNGGRKAEKVRGKKQKMARGKRGKRAGEVRRKDAGNAEGARKKFG